MEFKIKETGSDFYGLVADTSQETDFQAGGNAILPTPRHTYESFKIQYNQTKAAPFSCSIHGAVGAISDLTGKELSTDQLKEMWRQALVLGADPHVGWYINKAVDLARNEYFRLFNERLYSFNVKLGREDFWEAIDKGYAVTMGLRGNKEYSADFKDGTLDKVDFGKTTYGHCLRMNKIADDLYSLVVDNYEGRAPNEYRLKKANIQKLIDNGVFFLNGYYFAIAADWDRENNPEGIWANIPKWGVASVEMAIKAGILNWDNPNEIVGDATLEWMLVKAGGLTQNLGNVSKLRVAVAMHRLGLFDKFI